MIVWSQGHYACVIAIPLWSCNRKLLRLFRWLGGTLPFNPGCSSNISRSFLTIVITFTDLQWVIAGLMIPSCPPPNKYIANFYSQNLAGRSDTVTENKYWNQNISLNLVSPQQGLHHRVSLYSIGMVLPPQRLLSPTKYSAFGLFAQGVTTTTKNTTSSAAQQQPLPFILGSVFGFFLLRQ